MKCKFCQEEMILTINEYYGFHISCEHDYLYEKTEAMIKLRPVDGGSWCVISASDANDQDAFPDHEYEKVPVKMSKFEVESLPEHGGW